MKNIRQTKILEIIKNQDIFNQHDLLAELNKLGFDAAQPTISRDIKELGLIKVQNKNGTYKYATQNSDTGGSGAKSLFYDAVLKVDTAGNIVVIKCKVGTAQAACAMLDEKDHDSVVGTIAGDDTIFIATRSEEQALLLMKELTGNL